ncbi:phosphotransferase family protein [Clostridium diolis]|uniref:phosphotransferase family protein n=1 Tax=Clostridium diolis TaxID=223919 RepID=UPI003AF74AD6
MNSKTKNLISNEEIKKIVKANFGDSTVINNIKELNEGMFNSAYLIELNDLPGEIILKVGPAPNAELLTYEKDIMKTEIEVYKMIQSKTCIPVPQILKYDFSRKLISSDYFFMTKLNGCTWKEVSKKISKENKERLKEEIGKYTAELHSIKGEYFGYFTDNVDEQYKTWSEAFLAMIKNIMTDGVKHGIKLPYDKIFSVIEDKLEVLDEIKEPSLVDFDLWAGNVFLIKNGNSYTVEGIVDFERAYWGDPYADFTSSMMIYSDVLKEVSFQKGYSKKNNKYIHFSKEDKCRMFLYRIYMSLILAIESYRYGKIYAYIIKKYSKSSIKRYMKEIVKL